MMPPFDPDERQKTGVRRIVLLSSLQPRELAQIVPLMREERYERGDLVFTVQDESMDLFLIEQGDVLLYFDTPFGPQPLSELSGGALFGELPMLDGGGRSGTAMAQSTVTLWRLDGMRLLGLFERSSSLVYPFFRSFWRSLALRINQANGFMKQLFDSSLANTSVDEPSTNRNSSPGRLSSADLNALSLESQITPIAIDPKKKQEVLQDIGLTPAEINLLFLHGEEIALPAGSKLFCEGEFGDSLYFILHGEVRISKTIPGVGEEALAFLKPGQILGEMALATDQSRRTADCYAHAGPILLLGFSRASLEDLQWTTESELPFLHALCKMMAHRLRAIYDRLVGLRMMAGGF